MKMYNVICCQKKKKKKQKYTFLDLDFNQSDDQRNWFLDKYNSEINRVDPHNKIPHLIKII